MKRNKPQRLWTLFEERRLMEVSGSMARRHIAIEFDRTVRSIDARMARLKIRKPLRKWTTEEHDRLRDMYPTHTQAQCAFALGRTVKAVNMMVKKMGICKK